MTTTDYLFKYIDASFVNETIKSRAKELLQHILKQDIGDNKPEITFDSNCIGFVFVKNYNIFTIYVYENHYIYREHVITSDSLTVCERLVDFLIKVHLK